ncbi:hypothetical protein R1flu_003530 [Riccia fluitans]|uniref:Uncharacterized protein n=1 Tax=Riccia fluitans TaxID=41844 RepID=A0ABD1Y9B8_9MARC
MVELSFNWRRVNSSPWVLDKLHGHLRKLVSSTLHIELQDAAEPNGSDLLLWRCEICSGTHPLVIIMASPVEGLLYLAARKFDYHIKQTLLEEDKHKYQVFKQLMLDFERKSMGFGALCAKITELFDDYPNLAEEFRTFFPEQDLSYYKFITKTLKSMESAVEDHWEILERCEAGRMKVGESMDDIGSILVDHRGWMRELRCFIPLEAIIYGDSVKKHFAGRNREHRYKEFVRLLHELRAQCGEFSDVKFKFIKLFQNDPALILGFNKFLPENERIQVALEGKSQVVVHEEDAQEEKGKKMDVHTTSQLPRQEASLPPSRKSSSAINSGGWYKDDDTDSKFRRKIPKLFGVPLITGKRSSRDLAN